MLRQIAEQCGDPTLPQKIHEACLNKQAFLFVRGEAGFVLKPFMENGIPAVLIWAAWSNQSNGMKEHTGFIKLLARKIGARFLRFHTVRKGFLKVGKRYGWMFVGNDDDGFMIFEMRL